MNLDFEKQGDLLPAVVQDAETGEILMLAYMNPEAWEATVRTGLATFFSRSRSKLWVKGESSGHVLRVREIRTDCDEDAIVLRVEPAGPGVCHEGYQSCFYRKLENETWSIDTTPTFDREAVYGGTS